MSRIKNFFIILTFFLFTLVTSSCTLFSREADPSTFNDYTHELFLTIMGDDEFTSHFLFKNPQNYDLPEDGSISLPTPSTSNFLSKFIINQLFSNLHNYDYNKLNFDQQLTYNILDNLLDKINDETEEMSYLSNNYLGSYLGYQAQLPLLLNEYAFYDMDDINNYFTLIDLVPETFESYVNFEIKKAEKGYGMPDFVISNVIDQCTEFINDVENHFLIKTFDERINNLDFLANNNIIKKELIEKNYQKVTGPLKDGYQYIKDNLPKIYGKSTNNLGLYYYSIGKDYYSLLFKNETGYDIPIEEAITYIENKLQTSYNEIIDLVTNNHNLKTEIDKLSLMTETPEVQLNKFRQQIVGHFPTIDFYPTINIKYIDKSMENHFSPAAYMNSPIDDFNSEYIYLNNSSINGDFNYLYHTLAHEGIPGHLYQNIYFKQQDTNILRKVLKSSGYVEGWATYVEMYSFNFCNDNEKLAAKYLKLNNEFAGALQCRLDMGIHYEGWDVNKVYDYLNSYLEGYSLENAKSILEQLVEIPTNSQIYFFTYFKIQDMYTRTKNSLGNNFNEVEFHKLILDCGPIPLRYVESIVNQYINDNAN